MSKYLSLITNYHTKPKFKAHIDVSTQPFIDVITALQSLIPKFDIDTAHGEQLNILGEWIGRSRVISLPIEGIYFAFDSEAVGYDQGVWQGKYDVDSGLTHLSDDVYRMVLKIHIAMNHWDGSNEQLAQILCTALENSGIRIQIIDNQDMSISVLIFFDEGLQGVSKELLAINQRGYLNIKTAGVRVKSIETPSGGDIFFGFDIENNTISGFDQGSWGVRL